MWRLIKEWYKRNRVSLGILLGVSISIGVIIAATCLFFPSVLVTCATLTFLGVTPLVFLTTLHLPLAAFTLAAIMTGVSFGAITAGVLAMRQLTTIGKHLRELYGEEQQQSNTLIGGTYHYLHAHLQGNDSYTEEYDEEYNEVSSSNSSNDDDQDISTCSYDLTDSDNNLEKSIPYNTFSSPI